VPHTRASSRPFQLGVAVDANDNDLKKGYRKAAMKVRAPRYVHGRFMTGAQYHPDKNPSADAEEKFKDIRFVF
jgi:DnaJ-class molecular chaperone